MSTTAPTSRRPALPALTGIRFFAALAIVAHHFAAPDNIYVKAAVKHGLIGVSLFFILSGFILAYTYHTGPGAIKDGNRMFWAARFARIYPMHLVGMAMMAPLILAWSPPAEALHAGLAGVGLVQAWLPFSWRAWNPPAWSLSAEAFFYLTFPFAIKAISTKARRAAIALLLLCWAASLAAPAAYVLSGTLQRDFWLFNPLVRLPEFLIGVIVGVLFTDTGLRVPKYAVELAGAALLAILCIPMHEAWVANGTWAPLLVVILLGLAAGEGPVARLLATRPLVFLGGASFSLYILHWPLWYLTKSVAVRLHVDVTSTAGFWAVTLGVLVPASCLCFRFIEEPANRALRAAFARSAARRKQTAPGPVAFRDPLDELHEPVEGID